MRKKKELRKNLWSIRPSLYYSSEHSLDSGQNYGFDYHGKLFKKTVSPVILDHGGRKGILDSFDVLISYLIDAVKLIKKFRNYAIDKREIKMQ